jgi:hypothetical protein
MLDSLTMINCAIFSSGDSVFITLSAHAEAFWPFDASEKSKNNTETREILLLMTMSFSNFVR